jgi:hypothetical protein
MTGTDSIDPTDPTDGVDPTDRDPVDDVSWLRRELAGDGSGHVLTAIATGLRLLGGTTLAVLVFGVVAAALAVAAFRDQTALLVVALLACVPAVLAPFLAWRGLGRLRASVSQPAEVGRQARDLFAGLRDTTDIRALASTLRRRSGTGARPGRIRRAVTTGRLISTVIGKAGPDEDRHRLLVPFTPEHTARMFASITWSAWGLLMAFVVATVSILAIGIGAL